jgi:hypothetical protein
LLLLLLISLGGALTNRVSDLWESALTRVGLHMLALSDLLLLAAAAAGLSGGALTNRVSGLWESA